MDIPMFDIKIGTMIPGMKADSMIPQLNPKGFETYELHFENWNCDMDYHEHSKRVLDTLDGRKISVLGHYGNTLKDERVRRGVLDFPAGFVFDSRRTDVDAAIRFDVRQ